MPHPILRKTLASLPAAPRPAASPAHPKKAPPPPPHPHAGKTGTPTVPVIDPPANTEEAKTAPVLRTYTFPGGNLTPSETWTSGHRTPYGLAFGPDGRLWEIEHGPRGGDELNLIEPG